MLIKFFNWYVKNPQKKKKKNDGLEIRLLPRYAFYVEMIGFVMEIKMKLKVTINERIKMMSIV